MRAPELALRERSVFEGESTWVVSQEIDNDWEGVELAQERLPVRRAEAARIPLAVEQDVVTVVCPLLEAWEDHRLAPLILRRLAPEDRKAPAGAMIFDL